MAFKLIQQDAATLREAYEERKNEYEALRATTRWAGAVLHAGTLVELALKLVLCKHMGVPQLPAIFQVHDLQLLLYCSGLWSVSINTTELQQNFSFISDRWSMTLRYEGASKTAQDADDFDRVLFEQPYGVITFLSQYF